MDQLFGFDPAGDVVVVIAHDGDGWRLVRDDPAPTFDVPRPPQVHRWREVSWVETVEGWAQHYSEGEFVLTDEQKHLMRATYQRLVDEGKLTVWSNAVAHGDVAHR